MKKGVILSFAIPALALFLLSSIAMASCGLNAVMLNQDPYPANPDEYVKVVFQLNGTESPDCGEIYFDVVPEFPFAIDSADSKSIVIGGNFLGDYSNYMLFGYKLRIDKNALDGDNKIKVKYGNKKSGIINDYTKDFYINVKDKRTDFEVLMQDYNSDTSSITFALVNVGKNNAESLVLELPKQINIEPKGSNKAIIGSLDSNDDTTISINAIPKAGEIAVRLSYNDNIGVRREVEKIVTFTDGYLDKGTKKTQRDAYFYLFWILVLGAVAYGAYRYYKMKKEKKQRERFLLRNNKIRE